MCLLEVMAATGFIFLANISPEWGATAEECHHGLDFPTGTSPELAAARAFPPGWGRLALEAASGQDPERHCHSVCGCPACPRGLLKMRLLGELSPALWGRGREPSRLPGKVM